MSLTGNNSSIQGPADLYDLMLEVKNGCKNGSTRGCTWITKKQAKEFGISWKFVQQSVQILGLKMNRDGRFGYLISK